MNVLCLRQNLRLSLQFALLLGFAFLTHATTYFATPSGAGSKDGTDWNNAIDKSQINSFFNNNMGPGDTLQLGSGSYNVPYSNNNKIIITSGGTSSSYKTLEGVDTGTGRPVITGQWSETNPTYHAHSSNAIVLGAGADYLEVRGLDIQKNMNGITTSSSATNTGLRLVDLVIDNVREGIKLRDTTNSLIEDVTITRYTKRGIRFEVDANDLDIVNVSADCNLGDTTWPSEAFPFSFSMESNGGVHTIRYEGCVGRNNYYERASGEYWNGDGFVAESNVYGIEYYDCAAYDNVDGGWDDKSEAAYLENCIAMRNKRNFRVWNTNGTNSGNPTILQNCVGGYAINQGGSGSSDGLWSNGLVEAYNCTFHNNKSNAIHTESRSGYTVHAKAFSCILSVDGSYSTGNMTTKESGTSITLTDTAEWKPGSTGVDPQYLSQSVNWEGTPEDGFNSQLYGSAKGYHMGGQSPYNGPHIVPNVVKTHWFDNGGEGVAYHDTTAGNGPGYGRPDEDVDIGTRGSGTLEVRAAATEWLEYTFEVTTSGTYDLLIRCANKYSSGQLMVEVDDVDITGVYQPTVTGGWGTYATNTISGVNLSAGTHILRISIVNGSIYFRQWNFQ